LNKLPNIFHNSGKYITNNKNSFVNFYKGKNDNHCINRDNLINFFNKKITITLKSGNNISGVLLSKRENYILLDTYDYINIDEIIDIK